MRPGSSIAVVLALVVGLAAPLTQRREEEDAAAMSRTSMWKLLRVALLLTMLVLVLSSIAGVAHAQTGAVEKAVLLAAVAALLSAAPFVHRIGGR